MHWGDITERRIDLENEREVAELARFLARFGLLFNGAVEYSVALMHNGEIIATGSLNGEVLRNFAILEEYQGEDLAAKLASHLMREAARRGRHHYFIFTKPETASLFSSLGFREVGRVEKAALLETGIGSISSYCGELRALAAPLPLPRAALVVNCNPFTLGHRAVIERAARANAHVVVMVVSEEASVFPFDVRFQLIEAGLADLANVTVVPGGRYIVSAATFPGYFTRGTETILAQTELDATIFARHIAPALGVTRRYVGTEPLDPVTEAYNAAMSRIFPAYGLALTIMSRLDDRESGAPVSASRVRDHIRADEWDAVRALVPETTYRYLVSPEGAPVIARLKVSSGRH